MEFLIGRLLGSNILNLGLEGEAKAALKELGFDIDESKVDALLAEADCTREEAEAIYRLTSLPTFEERFVIPPAHREEAISALEDPLEFKGHAGFGLRQPPERAP